jgi:hypothetical protein
MVVVIVLSDLRKKTLSSLNSTHSIEVSREAPGLNSSTASVKTPWAGE